MSPKTSAWERQVRRREVIRHRYEEGLSAAAISDELDCSEATVYRDLQEIHESVATLGTPEAIHERLLVAVSQLVEEEFTDLFLATDLEAKHDAKASMRATLRLLLELRDDIESEESGEAILDRLPPEAQEIVVEAAEDEVAGILASESRTDPEGTEAD